MDDKTFKAIEMAVTMTRKTAHDAIGKAFNKMKKAGYGADLNLLAIMHELQGKFKD